MVAMEISGDRANSHAAAASEASAPTKKRRRERRFMVASGDKTA